MLNAVLVKPGETVLRFFPPRVGFRFLITIVVVICVTV